MNIKSFVIEIDWLPGTHHGWGNGYVALPEGHPCFGVDCDTINSEYSIDVHWGLTWSSFPSGLARVPADIKDDKFWIVGFDTAHAFDTLDTWPKEKVEQHARELAEQFENMKSKDLCQEQE